MYADDLLLFSKCKDLSVVQSDFSQIISKITSWSNISGAKLSYNKCTTFHICNKKLCPSISLNFNNVDFVNSSSLKFLGIVFDKKLTYKLHVEHLRTSLDKRLNVIKYLSSKHCLLHQTTLIRITKALILSKIDYGLTIYGHCARSIRKRLSPPYHAAARRSLRAFPTSQHGAY